MLWQNLVTPDQRAAYCTFVGPDHEIYQYSLRMSSWWPKHVGVEQCEYSGINIYYCASLIFT